jgi:hypothetical protein
MSCRLDAFANTPLTDLLITPEPSKSTIETRIAYVLVQDSEVQRYSSVFRLIPEANIRLLRSFMALAMLPGDAGRIRSCGRPFSEAASRVHDLPQIRITGSRDRPDDVIWNGMLNMPLVVLMVRDPLPAWLEALARERPAVVLSQSERALKVAESMGMFPGLLQGKEDLRQFYGALRRLCASVASVTRWSADIRDAVRPLGSVDLLAARSRLDFIPSMPLPPTDQGRSAAYLYNRLSNNVEEPTLAPSVPDGGDRFFRFSFRWMLWACRVLSLAEGGMEPPPALGITAEELARIYGSLFADSTHEQKRNALLQLGRRVSGGRRAAILVAAPVPRRDVVRGHVPEGAEIAPDFKRWSGVRLKAIKDLAAGHSDSRPDHEPSRKVYDHARDTLLYEDRLVACHAASLAARVNAEPWQLGPVHTLVHNDIANLNRAIDARSNKVATLFQTVEQSLAGLIPSESLREIAQGDGQVTFLSDLPFEWTAVDDWPLCLTKSVARIPLGMTRWDVLSAALESRVTIDSRDPSRVLVFDLIARDDHIRSDTDAFIASSEGLGQRYTYVTPANATEMHDAIDAAAFDIVVVDAHGSYDRSKDLLTIKLPDGDIPVHELVPSKRVPPLWILSACDTSVTGAMRGCFVRTLLSRGAVSVVATLAPVDAFTASMFVGKLLTDIYNPVTRGLDRDFMDVFFDTQVSTAVLYDPLLPLMRKAMRRKALKSPVGRVLGEFYAWARSVRLGPREFRVAAALLLGQSLERHGLAPQQAAYYQSGQIRPETLLFTAFGAPGRLELVD